MDLLFQSKYEFKIQDSEMSVDLNRSYLIAEIILVTLFVSILCLITLLYINDDYILFSILAIGVIGIVRVYHNFKKKNILEINLKNSNVVVEGKEWCQLKDLARIYITTSSDLDENGETIVYLDAKYKTTMALKEEASVTNSSCIDFCEKVSEKLGVPIEIKESVYLP